MRDPAPEVKQMGIIQDLSQGCIKLPGPRTVPVRSGSDGSRYFWCIEYPGLCLRAANRDGSRSDPELDAALGVRPRAKAPANDRFNGLLSSLQSRSDSLACPSALRPGTVRGPIQSLMQR